MLSDGCAIAAVGRMGFEPLLDLDGHWSGRGAFERAKECGGRGVADRPKAGVEGIVQRRKKKRELGNDASSKRVAEQ